MSRPATSIASTPETSDRTKKLRARRIAVDAEKLGEVRVGMRHPELGPISGVVQDLSTHGIAVTMPVASGLSGLVLNGDRLDSVEVTCDGRMLFRGTAIVRRISEEADRQILGIELEGGGLDLAELYRAEARQTFAQRWTRFETSAGGLQVSPEFKAWVADMRSSLEATRDFLLGEEKSLAAEDQLTRDEAIQQYIGVIRPRVLAGMDDARARLDALVGHLGEEEHVLYRAYLRRHLAPLFSESPFMRRSFEKPLGYAGDYEMMNMLYRDHAEGETLFGKALNIYATNEAAGRANINRITYLGAKIREAIAASSRERVRIASVGCGPSREIAALLRESPELGRRLDVALIDQEERSIAYCERTLTPLMKETGARIQFIRESVRRLLTNKRLADTLGEREFIYSAGLFDYLTERAFTALLSVLYGALAPQGHIVIGNIASHNPSRWPMEYFLDWFLIHRSPEDLQRAGEALMPTARSVHVEAEPTGVNLFLIVHR